MRATMWGALGSGAGLLCMLAGCGPAPYSLDPPEAPRSRVVIAQPPPAAIPPSPEIVVSTLRRHYPKFQKCYDKALRRDRGLRGTMVVRVTLDHDGDVDSAKDWGGDLPSRDMRECIIDVYEDIEFPEPAGDMVFMHPLRFELTSHGGVVQ